MSGGQTALLAIEQRVRSKTAAQISVLIANFGAYLAVTIRNNPNTSATEILSRHDVHEALTSVLNGAQAEVERQTRAGYEAAAALALVVVAAELRQLGHDAAPSTPGLSSTLDAILLTIAATFSAALLVIHNSVRVAHDGVGGDAAASVRVLTTNAALKRVGRQLRVRLLAAGTVAVHRGFTDAQLAAYHEYQQINPYIVLRKRWQTTAVDPCPVCEALNGTTVALGAEFDHKATTGTRTPMAVYQNLQGPPRHPNCRCRLVLDFVTTDGSTEP